MPLGEKLKNKYGSERLTTRSLRGGLGEGAVCHPPGTCQDTPGGSTRPGQPLHLRRPPSLCATSTGLSFTLLKTWVVDLVSKEGEEGKTKRIRDQDQWPGKGGFSAEQTSVWVVLATLGGSPYLPRPACQAGAGSASRGGQWGGVEWR